MLAFFELSAASPGTAVASPQWPFFSVRTNACPPDSSTYCPPAAQLPPEAHDTEFTTPSLGELVRCAASAVADSIPAARIGAVIAATAIRLLRICAPARLAPSHKTHNARIRMTYWRPGSATI